MTERKHIDVKVSWCNGDCSPIAKVPLTQWEAIRAGARASIDTFYWYEGARCAATFHFNRAKPGSLEVIGKDGFIGFEGDLTEASIIGGSAIRAS